MVTVLYTPYTTYLKGWVIYFVLFASRSNASIRKNTHQCMKVQARVECVLLVLKVMFSTLAIPFHLRFVLTQEFNIPAKSA